jgi:hypothetical protein
MTHITHVEPDSTTAQTSSSGFTDDEVRALRADTRSLLELSVVYGISEYTILRIKHRECYAHVDGPPSYLNQRGRSTRGVARPNVHGVANSQSKAVQTPDGRFASLSAVAAHYQISIKTIKTNIQNSSGWHYAD